MKTEKFDAIIIGSGQAGNPLAFALAAAGERVAIIESSKLGGTCLNTGCTPTKTYVASARAAWAVSHAAKLGIRASIDKVDLKAIRKRKDKIVNESRSGLEKALTTNQKITLIRGKAMFKGDKIITVNGALYTADRIYINVGARPRIPKGFEAVKAMTNESILRLSKLPDHLIIVGGSYIGLEFAQMFRRFGSKVTVIEKDDYLIGREDPETSVCIAEILKAEGVNIRLGVNCISGKTLKSGKIKVKVDCKDGAPTLTGSHLLLATGRQSNADQLGLIATNIAVDEKGYVQVDDALQTAVEGVFALGDCNGKGAFTHTAYNDFEIVNHNRQNKTRRKVSDRIINYALYTDPPLGRAGLSLNQAIDQGIETLYGRMEMKHVARAKEKGEMQGFMEVVVDAKTEKIVGAAVLGTGGDEIIGVFLAAMYSGTPYTILRDSVQTHPTVTELIPTMLQNLKPVKRKRKAP